ncbi:MAG: ParB N-terminal domain-containing protein [Candidatus Aureabacteria bacterium]|nr:ParB N-terminal domain-containing protein [Candidatus Auribacterota bacterium]
MLPERQLQTISLDQIDWDDISYRMSYFRDFKSLRRSILASGILNPPLVQEKQSGRYCIVCGYGRLKTLKEQPIPSAQVWTVSQHVPNQVLFDVAFFENLSTRTFHLIETAHIVRLIELYFSTDAEALSNRFYALELGSHAQGIEWLHDILLFSEPVQQAFARECISLDVLDLFKKIPDEEQMLLLHAMTSLKMGKNHQKEMVRLIEDILNRENQTLKELFALPEVKNTMDNIVLTRTQKTDQLLEQLKERRYPVFCAHHKKSTDLIHSLKLPASIQLQQDRYYEDDEYRLKFTFRSMQDFTKMLQTLQKLKKNRNFINLVQSARDE